MNQQPPDIGQPLIEFRDVSRNFGAMSVLRNVSLHVKRGETLVVIGESGCGKSVTMKLMMALLAGNVAARAVLGQGTVAEEMARQTQTTIVFVVFTIPLMLFSLPSALLADRFSKRSIIIAMKVCELVLMAAGTAVLVRDPDGGMALMVVLGLMGLQSAVFSPAKYGIMPQLCTEATITRGNGLLVPLPATLEANRTPPAHATAHPWRILGRRPGRRPGSMKDTIWTLPERRSDVRWRPVFTDRFLADDPALRDVAEPGNAKTSTLAGTTEEAIDGEASDGP